MIQQSWGKTPCLSCITHCGFSPYLSWGISTVPKPQSSCPCHTLQPRSELWLRLTCRRLPGKVLRPHLHQGCGKHWQTSNAAPGSFGCCLCCRHFRASTAVLALGFAAASCGLSVYLNQVFVHALRLCFTATFTAKHCPTHLQAACHAWLSPDPVDQIVCILGEGLAELRLKAKHSH